MLGKTHKAFSLTTTSATLLVAYPYLSIYNVDTVPKAGAQIILTLTTAWVSSTFPDAIERNILRTKHRGIIHAIWIPLGLLYASFLLREHVWFFPMMFGVFLGYLSHLVGDAFSMAGIAWFYPFQKYERKSNGSFYVKGNRGIFRPLYTVGKRGIINPVIFWYVVAFLISFFLWARIWN